MSCGDEADDCADRDAHAADARFTAPLRRVTSDARQQWHLGQLLGIIALIFNELADLPIGNSEHATCLDRGLCQRGFRLVRWQLWRNLLGANASPWDLQLAPSQSILGARRTLSVSFTEPAVMLSPSPSDLNPSSR